jgi:hypothetical protein
LRIKARERAQLGRFGSSPRVRERISDRLQLIMADTVLTRVYDEKPIDRAGGHDLQKMNERRGAYIAALNAADNGDFVPLMAFATPDPAAC